MAKKNLVILSALALVAVVLFSAADAFQYKTVVTTSVYEEGEGKQGCREQIQRQDFSGCERYMSDGNRRDLDRCCREMDRLDDRRCEREALREIMRRQGGGREMERQEMMDRAREIMQTCGGGGSGGRKIQMLTTNPN